MPRTIQDEMTAFRQMTNPYTAALFFMTSEGLANHSRMNPVDACYKMMDVISSLGEDDALKLAPLFFDSTAYKNVTNNDLADAARIAASFVKRAADDGLKHSIAEAYFKNDAFARAVKRNDEFDLQLVATVLNAVEPYQRTGLLKMIPRHAVGKIDRYLDSRNNPFFKQDDYAHVLTGRFVKAGVHPLVVVLDAESRAKKGDILSGDVDAWMGMCAYRPHLRVTFRRNLLQAMRGFGPKTPEYKALRGAARALRLVKGTKAPAA